MLKKHLDMSRKQKSMGKKYGVWDNKALLAVLPYMVVGWYVFESKVCTSDHQLIHISI
jgi:hypothetical protein